jgi:hypothetical protein
LPRLSIPERFRAGVAALARLPDDAFDKLLQAINAKFSADTSHLAAAQLEESLGLVPKPEISKLVIAIASIQSLERRSHVTPATLASDVAESLFADSVKLAEGIDRDMLKSRISAIAQAPEISITDLKIAELQTEVERSYCRGRILSDVRTAFSDDAEELPRGMTLLHTLQISYHDDLNRHREFYVTLENKDLQDLKEAIVRAEKKQKTLEQLLARADCRLFE